MARLSVREYSQVQLFPGGKAPMGVEPALTSQVLAIGAASTPSAVFNPGTRGVRVHCDVACSLEFSTDGLPVATVGSCDMAANQTEYFGVTPGTNMKLAVIAT